MPLPHKQASAFEIVHLSEQAKQTEGQGRGRGGGRSN